MQKFLRAWGECSERRNPAQMLDQASLPWFAELNRGLTDTLDDAAFARRMGETFAQLSALAGQIVDQGDGDASGRSMARPCWRWSAPSGDSERASMLFAEESRRLSPRSAPKSTSGGR